MTSTQMQSRLAGHFRLFTAWLGHTVAGIQSVAAGDGSFALAFRLALSIDWAPEVLR
jgi:hypothetical protein